MSSMIKAQGLSRKYGRYKALDNISFSIEKGRITGLIGPNGAGKTTLLKTILGFTAYKGDLRVLGLDPHKKRNQLMQNVSFIADVAVLPRWMTVTRALRFMKGIHPRFRPEKAEQLIEQTRIRKKMKIGRLSKGMVTQLHLALVMAIDADLLVLDEPTLGLDIISRNKFYQTLLNEFFNENRSIIITTHQIEEVEHILSDVIFINHGKIILSDSVAALKSRFTTLFATPEQVTQARKYNPLSEKDLHGKKALLFDGVSPETLKPFGEVQPASLPDLFMATNRGAGS